MFSDMVVEALEGTLIPGIAFSYSDIRVKLSNIKLTDAA
jgi:hypothetical protein